jgi:hypothetical protein
MTTLRRIAMSWLAGRGPSATAVVLMALVVLVAGCHREVAPPSHRLEGTYIVHGEFPNRSFGRPCKGAEAGYPNIQAGTMVVVTDEASAAVQDRPGADELEGRPDGRRLHDVRRHLAMSGGDPDRGWR